MANRQIMMGVKHHLSGFLSSKQQSCIERETPSRSQSGWKGSKITADYRRALDPKYNKGLAFSHKERQSLNVLGLFPAACRTMKEQLYAVTTNFMEQENDMARYTYLRGLRQRQERLYFQFVTERVTDVMPIIYTPTVGKACQKFSLIYNTTMGLYISKFDKGHIAEVLKNWPAKDIRAVCVTDGERILGLGDLGANGMGISVGKLDLYTALGKIPPQYLLPIMLDVGTNNKQLLCDPMYIGVRQERLRGQEYEDIVQELMDVIIETYGRNTLIHFEDFATPNAFKFINKYQNCYCYFNDDVQGTAATGLAGFLSIERVTKKKLQDHVILFVGAGSACLGISKLVLKELESRKLSEAEASKNIYLVDADGLITKDRKNVIPDVKPFMKDMKSTKDLEKLVADLKPSILLGATGMGGIFTENILRTMGKNHKQPAIFACSNPTNKAECTAEQAYNFTEGRALFCAGSPFPPVNINGKRIVPGQANNAFVFPGVALGAMSSRPKILPDEVYLVAARAISDFIAEEDPNTLTLYPPVKVAGDVAFTIAVHVATYLFEKELASIYPVPENICEFVKKHQYYTDYESALPATWEYPKLPHVPIPEKCNEDEEGTKNAK